MFSNFCNSEPQIVWSITPILSEFKSVAVNYFSAEVLMKNVVGTISRQPHEHVEYQVLSYLLVCLERRAVWIQTRNKGFLQDSAASFSPVTQAAAARFSPQFPCCSLHKCFSCVTTASTVQLSEYSSSAHPHLTVPWWGPYRSQGPSSSAGSATVLPSLLSRQAAMQDMRDTERPFKTKGGHSAHTLFLETVVFPAYFLMFLSFRFKHALLHYAIAL